jgi:hypothetical protein
MLGLWTLMERIQGRERNPTRELDAFQSPLSPRFYSDAIDFDSLNKEKGKGDFDRFFTFVS